jgi:4-hydroxy-2-oxoheptanedioate aldolase
MSLIRCEALSTAAPLFFMPAKNRFKDRVLAREQLIGVWIESASEANIETLAPAGFDFFLIDQEHGLGSISDAVNLLRTAESTGIPAVIRVPSHDPVYLKRILDAGARNIMIPQIQSAAEASSAVKSCFYPSAGTRGYAAGIVRASRFGADAEYAKTANENLVLILQIESGEAVTEAEAISKIPGVDVVFIGVNDLAGSLGELERTGDPSVQSVVRSAEDQILAAGKILGGVPIPTVDTKEMFAKGYTFIPAVSDVGLLGAGARDTLRSIREHQRT